HHLVVAPPGPVGVEVPRLDALLLEVAAGRAVALDDPGGRDVVGGDAVTEHGQDPGAADVGDRLGGGRHALEVRRVTHVGRGVVPGEALPRRHVQGVPALV